MNQFAHEPRHIRARFVGFCYETGLRIQPGDWIIFHPLTNDVYCAYSRAFKQFENAKYYAITN